MRYVTSFTQDKSVHCCCLFIDVVMHAQDSKQACHTFFNPLLVSEKACLEMVNLHEDLENKIDVEQRCREEAENYASKVSSAVS